jgi:hypothetical protein
LLVRASTLELAKSRHGERASPSRSLFLTLVCSQVRMNQDRERQHLAQADRHLVELKGHIVRQQEIVQRLALRGWPREEARRMLTNLQNSLRILQHHRRLIIEALQSPVPGPH